MHGVAKWCDHIFVFVSLLCWADYLQVCIPTSSTRTPYPRNATETPTGFSPGSRSSKQAIDVIEPPASRDDSVPNSPEGASDGAVAVHRQQVVACALERAGQRASSLVTGALVCSAALLGVILIEALPAFG